MSATDDQATPRPTPTDPAAVEKREGNRLAELKNRLHKN